MARSLWVTEQTIKFHLSNVWRLGCWREAGDPSTWPTSSTSPLRAECWAEPPQGEDVELGLIEDAVGIVGISPDVPADVRRKVAQEAARLRQDEAEGKERRS